MTIRNAKIASVFLGGWDDNPNGTLTFWLHLDFGGAGQGFGGVDLEGTKCFIAVTRILRTLEVLDWGKLPGQYVRVDGNNTKIQRIGHVLKDQWFDLKELA